MFALTLVFAQTACGESLRPLARAQGDASQFNNAALCGDPRIEGQKIPPVTGHLTVCGFENGVEVSAVSGVRLSRPSVMDCDMARALAGFSSGTLRKAVNDFGGGVAEINVIADFSCRTRNNRPGAKLSEHAKGRALDVSGFTLRNGETLNVLRDWNTPVKGAYLKRIWRLACSDFGTVLGPQSDRFHQDHFHFDVAQHRGGSYCR